MVEFQGTIKELRKQLLALQQTDVRNGRFRLAAGVISVACLAGAHFWRVLQWPALMPARCVLAITLLGCTVVLVRLWKADINDAKLSQINKLLSILRASVAGHGPLSLRADLGDPGAAAWDSPEQGRLLEPNLADHASRAQEWLSITAPLEGAQVRLCAQRATYTETMPGNQGSPARAVVVDGLDILFTSAQPDRVAQLKSAIEMKPHHEVRANVLDNGALVTTLLGAPREVSAPGKGSTTDTGGTALSNWLEWYLERLGSSQ